MDKLQEVVQKDCIYCGAQVGEPIGTREVRWKGELYLIEQIPIGVCNECGERFLSGIASSSLGSRHRRLHSLLPSTVITTLFSNAGNFANAQEKGAGRKILPKCLGKPWKQWQIQQALRLPFYCRYTLHHNNTAHQCGDTGSPGHGSHLGVASLCMSLHRRRVRKHDSSPLAFAVAFKPFKRLRSGKITFWRLW